MRNENTHRKIIERQLIGNAFFRQHPLQSLMRKINSVFQSDGEWEREQEKEHEDLQFTASTSYAIKSNEKSTMVKSITSIVNGAYKLQRSSFELLRINFKMNV